MFSSQRTKEQKTNQNTFFRTFKTLKVVLACTFFTFLLTLILAPLSSNAAPNPQINYQGKLTDNVGAPVADGAYDMEFSLYTVATSGSPIWTETLTGADQVQVSNGLFSVMLGSTTALTGVDFNQTLYLGVTVGADSEMAPRKILGTVPAAFEAENAQTLDGIATSSFLRSDQADTANGLLTFTNGLISNSSSTLANLTSVNATTTNIHVNGGYYDASNSVGQLGYVLQSTGTSTQWVATSSLNISSGSSVSFGTDNQIPYTNSGGTDYDYSSSFTFDGSVLTMPTFAASGTSTIAGALRVGTTTVPTAASTTRLFVDLGGLRSSAQNVRGVEIFNHPTSIQYGSISGASNATGGALVINHAVSGGSLYAPAINIIGGSNSLASISAFGRFLARYFSGEDNPAYTFTDDTDTGFYNPLANNEIGVSVGGDTITYFKSIGVGIGTSTPAYKLDIYGDARIDGDLYDATGSAGVAGYVLQSTASGIQWVATSSLNISSGSSVSFGTDNQIPFTNSGGTGYDYSDNFTFDGAQLTVAGNIQSLQDGYFGDLTVSSDGIYRDAPWYGAYMFGEKDSLGGAQALSIRSGSGAATSTGFSFDTGASGGSEPYDITVYDSYLWVTDPITDEVYQYTLTGSSTGFSFDTAASGNADPRGIIAYDGYFWVVDFIDDEVYRYTTDGTYTGLSFDTAANGSTDPVGITGANGYLWVVDDVDAEVYQYTTDGTYTGLSFDTAASGNNDPRGIVLYNNYFWIVDVSGTEVYQYTLTGSSTGLHFDLAASGNNDPRGMTATNGYFFVVDLNDDEVYQYTIPSTGGRIAFETDGVERLVIDNSGYITFSNLVSTNATTTANAYIGGSLGIGLSSPTEKLTVAGNIQSFQDGYFGDLTVSSDGIYRDAPWYGAYTFGDKDITGGAQALSIRSGSGAATSTGFSFDTNSSGNTEPYGATTYNNYFWVADPLADEVYQYNLDGTYTGFSFDTNASGNNEPRGIVAHNDYFWITDNTDDEVYQYTLTGSSTGFSFDTNASGNADPVGITTANGYFWIVDDGDAEVYQYNLDGTYTGLSFDTAASGNADPRGIVVYNNYFWVVETTGDEVYQYNLDGTYTGLSFDLAASGNADSRGIAAANGYLWVIDIIDDEVYQYTMPSTGGRIAFETDGVERLRIDSSGNIGIGTSSPAHKLDIYGDARIDGDLYDATGSAGAVGYVLQSTASGITWVATSSLNISSGSSVSFGTDNQIPYTNSGGDDYDYSSNFTFDGNTLTVTGDTIVTGNSTTTGTAYFGSNVTVDGNVLPDTTLNRDLGSASFRWDEVWAQTLNVGTSTWSIFNGANGRLAISDAASQGGSERLSILASGNVGIGTASPQAALHVAGDEIIFGEGEGGTPQDVFIRGPAAGTVNTAGGNMYFDASNGSGSGGSGALVFRTADAGSSVAVTLDATSTQVQSGSSNSISWAHTVASENNRLLLVSVAKASPSISSITYNGDNLTRLADQSFGGAYAVEMWYLINPDSGANTVQINFSSSQSVAAASAQSFYNVNQSTPFDTVATTTHGFLASASVNVSSAANELVVDAVGISTTGTLTPGGGQTKIFDVNDTVQIAGSTEAGAGSVTMSWTFNNPFANALIAVPIKPAGGGDANALADRLRITPQGNIGIGTSTPAHTLDIYGDARIDGDLYDATGSAGVAGYVLQSTASGIEWVATSSLGIGGSSLFTDAGNTTYLTSLTDQFAIGTSTALGHFTVVASSTANGTSTATFAQYGSGDILSLIGTDRTEKFSVDNNGLVNIGNVSNPTNLVNVHAASGDANFALIASAAVADALIGFQLDSFGTNVFTVGVDDSDGDKFKISGAAFGTNDRFVIDSNGRIGIGDTSPDDLLNVHSATAAAGIAITSLGANTDAFLGFQLADGTNNFTIGVDDSDSDKFKISGAALGTNDRFVITSTGAIGIGTSTPAHTLDIYGDARIDGDLYDSAGSAGALGYVLQSTATGIQWVATSSLGISSGSSVSFGTDSQIPFMNSGNTDFQYTSSFSFNEGTNTLTLGNLTLSDTLVAHTGAATTTVINNNPFAWTIATSTSGTPLLRIDTTSGAEQVIIGNANIGGTTDVQVGNPSGTGDAAMQYGNDSNAWTIGYYATDKSFRIASSTNLTSNVAFTVTKGGNVGIGSSTPSHTLSVDGTIGFANLTVNTGGVLSALCLDSNNQVTRNTDNETCVASSERYKHGIEALVASSTLDTLMALRPVSFAYNSATGTIHYGFIAEEVLEIDERLVSFNSNGDPQSVRYIEIIPLLTASVQELNQNLLTIASSSSTTTEASEAYKKRFFEAVFARINDWFAEATNGIGDFFANRVRTKELCVGEEGNETCITKSQLDDLLHESQSTAQTPSNNSNNSNSTNEPPPPSATTTPTEPNASSTPPTSDPEPPAVPVDDTETSTDNGTNSDESSEDTTGGGEEVVDGEGEGGGGFASATSTDPPPGTTP